MLKHLNYSYQSILRKSFINTSILSVTLRCATPLLLSLITFPALSDTAPNCSAKLPLSQCAEAPQGDSTCNYAVQLSNPNGGQSTICGVNSDNYLDCIKHGGQNVLCDKSSDPNVTATTSEIVHCPNGGGIAECNASDDGNNFSYDQTFQCNNGITNSKYTINAAGLCALMDLNAGCWCGNGKKIGYCYKKQ